MYRLNRYDRNRLAREKLLEFRYALENRRYKREEKAYKRLEKEYARREEKNQKKLLKRK